MTDRPDLERIARAIQTREGYNAVTAEDIDGLLRYALRLERQHAASQERADLADLRERLMATDARWCAAARELGAARQILTQVTELLNQDGGWCNHGVLMDRPYHPRCSHCVLSQARAAIACGEGETKA